MLAFSGDPGTLPWQRPSLFVTGNTAEVEQNLIFGDHHVRMPETPYTATSTPSMGFTTLSFVFDPAKLSSVYVAFRAGWTSNREGSGTCWLTLPSLLNNGSAMTEANTVLGHPEWPRSALGQPVEGGATYINLEKASHLVVNPALSVPVPVSLEPADWSCVPPSDSGSCQAIVALEEPGAANRRLRDLVVWSLIGGLLLAFVGDALIGAVRGLLRAEDD